MAVSKIKAIYSDYTKFKSVLSDLAHAGDHNLEILSPVPLHEVAELFPQKASGVRIFAFCGAILGLIVGLGFPVYTVTQWPLITGGKPIVTYQTFIIIAFELLILFGAIATLVGLLFHARLPRANLSDYDVRISENAYGVIVTSEEEDLQNYRDLLKEAEDITISAAGSEPGEYKQ